MIALEQKLEQARVGTAFGQRLYLQRPQGLEWTVDGIGVVSQRDQALIAEVIDRSGSARRQFNGAAGFELEQQRAAGHVLEASGGIAPVP